MKKSLIAGLVGGLIVFVWGAFSHMVLPLGEMGFSILPNEDPVLEALKSNITEPGLYFFPGMSHMREATPEEMKAWEEKYKAGPIGLLLFNPQGEAPMSPRQLGMELFTNVLAASIIAIVLSSMSVSIIQGSFFSALLGLFAWLSISASYWNWYSFPSIFILAEGFDQVISWLLGGLAITAIVKK